MIKLGDMVDMPIHSVPVESKELILPFAKVGIEVELEDWDGVTYPSKHYWAYHDEGSLRNSANGRGAEFVTAGNGIVGEDIRKALQNLFNFAIKKNWSIGFPRAGIHVHLDVTDLAVDNNELAVLVSNYMIVEHILFGFAGDHRRATGYSVAYEDSQADFQQIARLLYGIKDKGTFKRIAQNLSKYQALNLNPLPRQGTIEFRHLPTTFDVERVMLWINMILAIKKSASDPAFSDPLLLLTNTGAEEYCHMILGRTWDQVSKHLNVIRVWRAVDNAQALLMLSGKVKYFAKGWEAPEISPLIESKKAKFQKQQRKGEV